MPLYKLDCKTCNIQWEDLLKISENPPPCPSCHGPSEKKIGLSNFSLKGSCWAKDGYS